MGWIILVIVALILVTLIGTASQVWVGHIPKQYNYNPEFPKPFTIMAWTNMNSKVVQKGMLGTIDERKKELEEKQAPEGIYMQKFDMPVDDGQIKMYCVEPKNLKGQENVPVVYYIHGGAFYFPLTVSDIDSMSHYAKKMNVRVFMPDYRTSLEHPFPTPHMDCYEALKYLKTNEKTLGIDMNRYVVMGGSAGGAIAAGLAQYVRDFGGPVAKAQVLIFPVLDNSMNYQSMKDYEDAPWSKSSNEHMWSVYLAKGDTGMLKYAAPVQSDNFSTLPPAYIEPSEMDILRDEALAYADKLREAGVEVESFVVPGGYHGFDADLTNAAVLKIVDKRIKYMLDKLEV